jgi:transposase-like protein
LHSKALAKAERETQFDYKTMRTLPYYSVGDSFFPSVEEKGNAAPKISKIALPLLTLSVQHRHTVDETQTTSMRWVPPYVPEFGQHWQRYARPLGTSWRVDEPYIKISRKWDYFYRCGETEGHIVDFLLSEHRDMVAAERFFARAGAKHGIPQTITLDGYATPHEAVADFQAANILPANLLGRTHRYLHNGIERDHRRVKQRESPAWL